MNSRLNTKCLRNFHFFVLFPFKENTTNILTFHRKLENELMKRKENFPNVTLEFRKKGVYLKFPFYSAK